VISLTPESSCRDTRSVFNFIDLEQETGVELSRYDVISDLRRPFSGFSLETCAWLEIRDVVFIQRGG
jgi:hypothetical protein